VRLDQKERIVHFMDRTFSVQNLLLCLYSSRRRVYQAPSPSRDIIFNWPKGKGEQKCSGTEILTCVFFFQPNGMWYNSCQILSPSPISGLSHYHPRPGRKRGNNLPQGSKKNPSEGQRKKEGSCRLCRKPLAQNGPPMNTRLCSRIFIIFSFLRLHPCSLPFPISLRIQVIEYT